MERLKKILVPTDFSRCSETALELASELAESFGATIDLLHVWDAPPFISPETMVGAIGESQTLANLVKRQAESQMEKFVESARAKGFPVKAVRIEHGAPAPTIVDVAKQGDYDLVALGTHGRTGLSHLVIGSVAEKVVRYSDRPVLTVRDVKPDDSRPD